MKYLRRLPVNSKITPAIRREYWIGTQKRYFILKIVWPKP